MIENNNKPIKKSEVYVCPMCYKNYTGEVYTKAGICKHCGMDLVKKSSIKNQQNQFDNNVKQLTIAFYLQPGVEVLDFAGPMEVFTDAGYKVFTISKIKGPIYSQGVLKVMPDYDITNAPKADVIAFFGGGNARNSGNDPELIKWVKERGQQSKYVFSVCTGAFIIANAGLLDGMTATTFHSSIDALRNSFPKIKVLSKVRFVDNGRIITTAGISAGIDGALHLVSKFSGEEVAKNTALIMEYDKWIPNQGLIINNENNK